MSRRKSNSLQVSFNDFKSKVQKKTMEKITIKINKIKRENKNKCSGDRQYDPGIRAEEIP
jgi:hypothetical protein